MAGRIYHWKHGWIPLDHYAAVSHFGGEKGAASHGFAAVSNSSFPRASHVSVTHNSNTGTFTVKDLQSGNSFTMPAKSNLALHEGLQVKGVTPYGLMWEKKPSAPKTGSWNAGPKKIPMKKSIPAKKQVPGHGTREDFLGSSPMTTGQKAAIKAYGEPSGYKTVNPYLNNDGQVFDSSLGALRPATQSEGKTAIKLITSLDAAFKSAAPLKHDVKVIRRSGSEQFPNQSMAAGSTFMNRSYVSTALPGGQSHGYGYESKKVSWEITLPKGFKALQGNKHENEVLLPRGTKFKVQSDTTDANGLRHLKVRAVMPFEASKAEPTPKVAPKLKAQLAADKGPGPGFEPVMASDTPVWYGTNGVVAQLPSGKYKATTPSGSNAGIWSTPTKAAGMLNIKAKVEKDQQLAEQQPGYTMTSASIQTGPNGTIAKLDKGTYNIYDPQGKLLATNYNSAASAAKVLAVTNKSKAEHKMTPSETASGGYGSISAKQSDGSFFAYDANGNTLGSFGSVAAATMALDMAKETPSSSSGGFTKVNAVTWSGPDGGTIEKNMNGEYVAYDATGEPLGTYTTLGAAKKAFPQHGAASSLEHDKPADFPSLGPPPPPYVKYNELTQHRPGGVAYADYQSPGLDSYVGVGYTTINGGLRGGYGLDETTSNHIKDIDNTFDTKGYQLPQDLAVTRGASFDDWDAEQMFQTGGYFTEPGYMSTTVDRAIAEGFDASASWSFDIKVPAGKKVLTPGMGESEVLLPRNSAFKIRKVDRSNRHVWMEMV